MCGVIGEDGLVPRARSRLPVVCAAGLGLLMLVFAWLLDSDSFRERAGMFLFCLTVERFIHSMCLFAEEWLVHSRQRLENKLNIWINFLWDKIVLVLFQYNMLFSRYHGRINEIFQACFQGHVILGMCAIFLMLMFGGVSFSHEQWSTMTITCAVYLLLNSLGVLVRFIPCQENNIHVQIKNIYENEQFMSKKCYLYIIIYRMFFWNIVGRSIV